MKFERLRLAGFKSFCDPTDFKIESGLTGVVGPNGCGKSNLLEALRWVMGESSYKNMRASGMDDVIFSGTGKRPSRNIAEVGLVLDNSDRRAPAAFNDAETIEVTRRIERESGSTYRVNGREVRARDVQLLFADASTGARSPAMVRQGQIGEIIAAKPQARRLILEEAAGVSGLHSRRHEAELRLKGAEDNLLRLEDVLKQIDAQVDSLKRQARQSTRYRNLAQDIRRHEALARLIAWREHEAQFAKAQHRLEEDVRAVAERTRAQGEAARLQAIAAAELPSLRDEEARLGAALHRLVLARDALAGEEKRAKDRVAELERRIAQLAQDLAARGGADRRRRACHDEADGRGRDARRRRRQVGRRQARGRRTARAPRAAARRRRSRSGRGSGRLRRPQRAAQRARRGARRGGAPSRPLRKRMRGGRAGARRVAGFRRRRRGVPRRERGARVARRGAGRGRGASAGRRSGARRGARGRGAFARTARRSRARRASARHRSAHADQAHRLDLRRAVAGRRRRGQCRARLRSGARRRARRRSRRLHRRCGARPLVARPRAITPIPNCRPASNRSLSRVEAPRALRAAPQSRSASSRAPTASASRPRCGRVSASSRQEGDLWRWDGFVSTAEAPTPAARRLVEKNRLGDLSREAEAAQASGRSGQGARRRARRPRCAKRRTPKARLASARAKREAPRTPRATSSPRPSAPRADAFAPFRARRGAGARADIARRGVRTPGALRGGPQELAPSDELALALERARAPAAQERADFAEAKAAAQTLAREAEARAARRARSPPSSAPGSSGGPRRRPISPRSPSGALAAQAELESLADAPAVFFATAARAAGRLDEAETARKAAADARVAAETALAEADRAARAALEAMGSAREARAASEERLEGARAGARGVAAHDRRGTGRRAGRPDRPGGTGETARSRRTPNSSSASWKACARSASGWAPSTCAPTRNWPK